MPFENSVDLIELRGEHIWDALEYSVAADWHEPDVSFRKMLQMSGKQWQRGGYMHKASASMPH